jgi:phosphoribosyl 1,2-cyclic phosphodiesterase
MVQQTDSRPQSHLSVCVLASGSKGNSIYIGSENSAILVDAGLSGKEIERRLKAAHLSPHQISALIVSHEHSDHIRGIGIMARRYNLPVYISSATARAAASQMGRVDDLRNFVIGTSFVIDDMTIHPFATCHDAEESAGFTIEYAGHKMGLATDLGVATGMVKHHLKDCTLVVIEANHDPTMLTNGPYPWPLKQRIKSRDGHLSNEASRDLLAEIRHRDLRHVILAHLSEINNTPEKAIRAVQPVLENGFRKTTLHVACQDKCTGILKLV